MNLHHKALRHFISASVIVLTSSFLIYELIASDRAMNAYMRYIMERADSSFLYDKYQNQSIAAHLMRTFEAPGDPVTAEKRRAFPVTAEKRAARFATPLRLLTVRTAST
ncbi:Putative two-component response regulator and GGDEF family protein YeaJ [Salmonella enterica subsp. enterica serovar Senftenberg str. A4-543]|uniref:Putative two-component response regulator and GGDEF family protein YeaJ n=1 Tax=Salmonella enterica subsp. enterica serovar Senftenberg str. A4-543 TaxID=913082 RepID=G5R149_SALSE|nr:Putative two-component response regulator and GGDEF family protein YeaJ [Salmonella enterica subsp. enterica serovar Senftenberg str. A4-543]